MTMARDNLGEQAASRHVIPKDDAAIVLTTLERQRALYGSLDELSSTQGTLIDEDRTDELLSLLARREQVVGELDALSTRLAPLRGRWDAIVGGMAPPERDRVRRLVAEMTALAAAVASRDEADRARMSDRRDQIGRELASLGNNRRAQHAYGAAPQRSPRFQDREA